jgi:hypothetical protein
LFGLVRIGKLYITITIVSPGGLFYVGEQLAEVGGLGNLSLTVCPDMVAQISLVEIGVPGIRKGRRLLGKCSKRAQQFGIADN